MSYLNTVFVWHLLSSAKVYVNMSQIVFPQYFSDLRSPSSLKKKFPIFPVNQSLCCVAAQVRKQFKPQASLLPLVIILH